MNWSLTIGRIAGTNIRLHITFLIFLIWIGIADYLAGGPAAAVQSSGVLPCDTNVPAALPSRTVIQVPAILAVD